MKKIKQGILVFLCFIIAFGLISCKSDPVKTIETQEMETSSKICFFDYGITRAESASAKLIDEISNFYGKFLKVSGKDNFYETDYLDKGEEPSADVKEILIGHTNHPETQGVLLRLSGNEYAFAVIGNKIVITGLNDTVTAVAVRCFSEMYLGEGATGLIETDFFYKGIAEEKDILEMKKNENVVFIDSDVQHKFIATDIINFSLVVYDLNLCDGDLQGLSDGSAIIWEWKSKEDPNCKLADKIIRSISGVKFRYSEYYKRDVVIACANFGWVGVVDYENCSLIWECELPTGPHSVEMLPNGDVVVASAEGEAGLIYIPLSAGATKPTHSIVSPSCHGVSWDPENECLWVLELDGIYACKVENMGTVDGKLVRVQNSGDTFSGDRGGHALASIANEEGKYWVSAMNSLWKFDTQTQKISYVSSLLSRSNIKGICSFYDGVIIELPVYAEIISIAGEVTASVSLRKILTSNG